MTSIFQAPDSCSRVKWSGSRTVAVDLFNRTLLSDFLPVQGARGLGLYLMDRIGPLRRAVMREGIAPSRMPSAQ